MTNDFFLAYRDTLVQEGLDNIKRHGLSTEQLSPEQREALISMLQDFEEEYEEGSDHDDGYYQRLEDTI